MPNDDASGRNEAQSIKVKGADSKRKTQVVQPSQPTKMKKMSQRRTYVHVDKLERHLKEHLLHRASQLQVAMLLSDIAHIESELSATETSCSETPKSREVSQRMKGGKMSQRRSRGCRDVRRPGFSL